MRMPFAQAEYILHNIVRRPFFEDERFSQPLVILAIKGGFAKN